MRNRCSDERLREVVKNCASIRAVLKELGLAPAGGNYVVLKKRIAQLRLDTSHFLGQAILRGRTLTYRTRPIAAILVRAKIENSFRLRNRLLSEGVKAHRCERCLNIEWLGRPVPLELHHKDGDITNNALLNLELLCPNCHAMTDNYRGRKKRRCRDCTAET